MKLLKFSLSYAIYKRRLGRNIANADVHWTLSTLQCLSLLWDDIRENFKNYFADFVRKGGGGTPQIRNSLFAENFVRKGGEGGTPQIRNLFFGPKSGVF